MKTYLNTTNSEVREEEKRIEDKKVQEFMESILDSELNKLDE
jgi:hypothetical protein